VTVMKRHYLLPLLITLLLPASLSAGQRVGELAFQPAHQTDRLIIKQRPQSDERKSAMGVGRVTDLGIRAGVSLTHQRSMSGRAEVVRLPRHYTLAELGPILELLNSDPDIEYAEPDLIRYPLLFPNDPEYANQWHYHDPVADGQLGGANLPKAWDITTGSNTVVVAILDTGLLPHTDIVADGDILDNDDRVLPGYDFITDVDTANDTNGRDNNPTDSGDWVAANECAAGEPAEDRDSSWHGTHVTGTIGALSNNESKVTGVDWNARLLPVRVLGKCGGYTSDIIDAMRWSAGLSVTGVPNNPNPAKVLNLSLGGDGACLLSEQSAINDVINEGAIVVVAAGNSTLNLNTDEYSPANCDNVITVAATDNAGAMALYSNYGITVEIAAPGGGGGSNSNRILSTDDGGNENAINDNATDYKIGTSMATPHVAGVASLMFAVNNTLTPARLLEKLQFTARTFPTGTANDCTTSICGSGIVDAYEAVKCAQIANPVANAGANQMGYFGTPLPLTGSGSDNCTIASHLWTQTGGDAAIITNATTATPTITIPSTTSLLTLQLTVTDDDGLTHSDTMQINANNIAPVLATIGNKSVTVGDTLSFTVSATDTTTPSHTTTILPAGASYTDNGEGSATFNWPTTAGDAGSYNLTFTTTDSANPALTDSETITITVSPVVNVAPVLAAIGNKSVTVGNTLNFTVTASDTNGTIPSHSVASLPASASYTDLGNGSASFSWAATSGGIGNYNLIFTATDGVDPALTDSETITITVAAVATEESSSGGGGGSLGFTALLGLLWLVVRRIRKVRVAR